MYEAIAYAPADRLIRPAERCLEDAEVEVRLMPETALVMARVRETVDGEAFNLGEVLVTRCEVSLGDEPGFGMVLGDAPKKALCAAVLDAASRLGFPEGVEEDLELQLSSVRGARERRWASVQPTRVEFEEMAT